MRTRTAMVVHRVASEAAAEAAGGRARGDPRPRADPARRPGHRKSIRSVQIFSSEVETWTASRRN